MHGTMVKLLLPRIFIRYGPAQYSALQGMFAMTKSRGVLCTNATKMKHGGQLTFGWSPCFSHTVRRICGSPLNQLRCNWPQELRWITGILEVGHSSEFRFRSYIGSLPFGDERAPRVFKTSLFVHTVIVINYNTSYVQLNSHYQILYWCLKNYSTSSVE